MTSLPSNPTPPSAAQLVKAAAAAAAVATLVLVCAVLPAEYGIDPTGIGRAVGLTAIGAHKMEPAVAMAADCVSSTTRTTIEPGGARTDELELTLPPKKGAEIKAFMKSGEELTFEWTTGGPALYFDFHGEALDAPEDVFTSYETGTQSEASGSLRPAFDGRHGWYWRNDTDATIVVRLQTSGGYDDVRRM